MLVIIGQRHDLGLRSVFILAWGVWVYAFVWLASSVF